MKKLLILVLTNFFILTLILLSKPVKAQTTEITSQFLYGLQLYVLPEKSTNPDYSTAIYSSTIDENDFLTSGLYQNWCQPRLPDGINGYIYLVDSTHTIKNVYLGGGYLEQGQTLSYPYEPSIEMKHYGAPLITIFWLNPVNKGYFETPTLDYIVYFENNDGSTPRIKLIDATTNENDYNRVKLAINGYDTGYNAGYSIGYNNGQVNGYNNGYEDGQTNGYSAGYNAGQYDFYNEYYQEIYDNGYKAGLRDAEETEYIKPQLYQQLVINGDFKSNINWSSYLSTLTIFDNIGHFTATANNGLIYNSVNPTLNHKYYVSATIKLTTPTTSVSLRFSNKTVAFTKENTDWQKLDQIVEITNVNQPSVSIEDLRTSNWDEIQVKNVFAIDLTSMYGEGNEPTITETREIFNDVYYYYSSGELIKINYLDGYNEGKAAGIDEGISIQATQQLTSDGWIQNIFTGIGSFLALEILPNVSIGLIVGIPFIISVAWFVIKMARGGGNN